VGLDRISVVGLRVFAYHGVRDEERRDGQDFIIDAVVWLDTAAAAAGDELGLTVDYAALAERLAAACLSDPPVQEVEITVHKPHAPLSHPFDDVTVVIRRVRG
jgi:dihydroneopterin aldolase